ncbi:MAG: DUF2237 domain-containing protein [Bdellovibrionales bacterium]|nr:DUF2237 domain-containing protein [Bdellovibrionales bacterium]
MPSLEKDFDENVWGEELMPCSLRPITGFVRDGKCSCFYQDPGQHTLCAVMTKEFLEYSKAKGNDLSTPVPEYEFEGLKAGDHWCLCADRWIQALEDGKAPKIKLESTHRSLLKKVSLEVLEKYNYKTEENS